MVSTTIENADRISDLPEAILCHILSFLPTIDSVRTRVLSTRWKHLFSLVPILVFSYDSTKTSNSNGIISSLDFVNWVFNSYNVDHMDTFHFRSSCFLPETSRLLSWISDSVRRRVHKLEIHVPVNTPQMFPRDVFTCKTLSALSISGHFSLDVPENVCLPCVKTIALVGICFIDGGSAQRLFRCCPVLEDLCIDCYHSLGDIQVLDISVSSLKILKIVHGYKDDFDLVLNVPNVENFVYIGEGMATGSYSVRGLKSSAKAYIKYDTCYHKGYKAIEELVRSVCHIQHLTLCGSMLKAFLRSGVSIPMFCNLTHLGLKNISCSDSKMVLDLLDRTPHLQVLVVDNRSFSPRDYGHCIHFSPERVPACVSLHLKKVELKVRFKLDNEFKMVEYFLQNAKILDILKIQYKRLKMHSKMRNKLLSFSRSARACQIVLVSDTGEI